jgi:cytochrome c oxidase cbb3-type subunit 4
MHLNLEALSSAVTVLWLLAFIALCLWAWSGRRRKDFDAAARLPFDDPADGSNEHDKGSRRCHP